MVRRKRQAEQAALAAEGDDRAEVEKIGRQHGAEPHHPDVPVLLDDVLDRGVSRILHEREGVGEPRGVQEGSKLSGRLDRKAQ